MEKSVSTPKGYNPDRQYLLWSLLIVLAGLVLRLIHLDFSYSNDELSALSRVRFDTFGELVRNGFYVDGHPGGIQVFLYYWVKLFGMNEIAVRLPFAIAGAAGIWFIIRTFTYWFGKLPGLLTGAFVSFLAFPLLFSQIARPYGIGLSLSMLMAWFWTRLLFDEKPRTGVAAAYALSAAACMYNHYFSFLLALIMGITGLFLMKKDRIYHYLGAGLAAALLFSPHIPITLNHLGIGGVGLWLAKPDMDWPIRHIAYIFNNSWLTGGLAVALVVLQLFFYKKDGRKILFRILALIFFLLPMIIGFAYSRIINPVLQDSVLIFSFPFLLGFLFSFADGIPRKWIPAIVGVTMLTGIVQTVFIHKYYSRQHFGEFRGVAEALCNWEREYGSDEITHAISVNNPWYIEFYLDRAGGCKPGFRQYDNRGGEDLDALKMILDKTKTPYFAYSWTKPVPREIRDMVLSRFPCVADERNFSDLADATLFSRIPAAGCLNKVTGTFFRMEFPEADYDSTAFPEFFPGFEGVPEKTDDQMVALAVAITEEPLSGALLVVSFHDEAGETLAWAASRFDLFTVPGTESTVRITLPDEMKPFMNDTMKVYVWNPEKKNLKIKSLTIITEKISG